MMITLLQTLFQSIGCQRRATAANNAALKPSVGVSDKGFAKFSSRHISAYEDSRSTDTSGAEKIAESFDGSDTDETDLMPRSEPSTGSTDGSDDGTSGPPSRPRFADLGVWQQRNDFSSRLNPMAAPFVPSSALPEMQAAQSNVPLLRGSIRSLVAALDEWEASTAAEDFFGSQQGKDMAHDPTSAVLQQVMSKLSPQDSAMIKAFVDAKIAQGVHCVMAGSPVEKGHNSAADAPCSSKAPQKAKHKPTQVATKVSKGARLRKHHPEHANQMEMLR